MVVDVSSSTVTLDHLYAKKDVLLDEDILSSASDFLDTWAQVSCRHPIVEFHLLWIFRFSAELYLLLQTQAVCSCEWCLTTDQRSYFVNHVRFAT